MEYKLNEKTIDISLVIEEVIAMGLTDMAVWGKHDIYDPEMTIESCYIGKRYNDSTKDKRLASYKDFVESLDYDGYWLPPDDYPDDMMKRYKVTVTAPRKFPISGMDKTWYDFMGDQSLVEQIINMATATKLSLYVCLCSDGSVSIAISDNDINTIKTGKDKEFIILKVKGLTSADRIDSGFDYSNPISDLIAQYERIML